MQERCIHCCFMFPPIHHVTMSPCQFELRESVRLMDVIEISARILAVQTLSRNLANTSMFLRLLADATDLIILK